MPGRESAKFTRWIYLISIHQATISPFVIDHPRERESKTETQMMHRQEMGNAISFSIHAPLMHSHPILKRIVTKSLTSTDVNPYSLPTVEQHDPHCAGGSTRLRVAAGPLTSRVKSTAMARAILIRMSVLIATILTQFAVEPLFPISVMGYDPIEQPSGLMCRSRLSGNTTIRDRSPDVKMTEQMQSGRHGTMDCRNAAFTWR